MREELWDGVKERNSEKERTRFIEGEWDACESNA